MDCIGTRNLRQVLEYKAKQFGARECLVFEDAEGYVVSYTYRALMKWSTGMPMSCCAAALKKATRLPSIW